MRKMYNTTKKPKSACSMRLSDNDLFYASNVDESLSIAVSTCLCALHTIEDEARGSMRGMFKDNEWKFMAYVLHLNPPRMEQKCRVEEVAQCINMARAKSTFRIKYGVNVSELDRRISALTSAQVFALVRRIETFWRQVDGLSEDEIADELDDFANY